MTSTIVLFALLVFGLLGSMLLWGLLLRLGLRWANVDAVTWPRVAWVTCPVFTTQVVLTLGTTGVVLVNRRLAPAAVLLLFVANVGVPCAVTMQVFRVSLWRALQAWVPTLVTAIVSPLLIEFFIRPYVVEAFVSPSNAMAPTLLGDHWVGTCVECGSSAFSSPVPDYALRHDPLMICRDNFHVMVPVDYSKHDSGPDRFLAAKYLSPARWDLAVFRYPADPETLYVMRVLGLPGEEITIEDGKVRANGAVLTPPAALRGLEYANEMEGADWDIWGSPQQPAQLGDDEYFVLGDFSARSKDSRMWQDGAPGHKPFAVPASYMQGVVTHIYWPPSRWRMLR